MTSALQALAVPSPRPPQQTYDRVVSVELLTALAGPLVGLLHWREADLALRDVQLRKQPKGQVCWASLYVGLTSVLNVQHGSRGFRLTADATHVKAGGLPEELRAWQTLKALSARWPDVAQYLERVVPAVDDRWTDAEGQVHALLANSTRLGATIINREASHSFADVHVRAARSLEWREPIKHALAAARGLPDASGVAYGHSPDFIALDDSGRLLVIEAKPWNASATIALAPAQVAHYAAMYSQWLQETPGARAALEAQLAQRKALGLIADGARTTLSEPVRVVPVVAVGPGPVRRKAWTGLAAVAFALVGTAPEHVEPLEVWVLDEHGAPEPWSWWVPECGLPSSTSAPAKGSSFRQRARVHAQLWKEDVLGLDEHGAYPAGSTSTYPFVLPRAEAVRNLLPGNDGAVALFQRKRIQWHRAVDGGPTNHLLSSQVQCVNALYPALHEPSRLVAALPQLDIARVLPIEDEGHVAFEYVGDGDLLGEGKARRGAGRTSLDAAFRYETSTGAVEMALVEWKYTEQYSASGLSGDDAVRLARYQGLWADTTGPFHSHECGDGELSLVDLLVEPLYQLVRQQLLAWRLEQTGAASVVRVLHVVPEGNVGYQASVPRPQLRELGSTVREVWEQLLRPAFADRSLWVDSSTFLSPDITSDDYCARYGHL